MFEPRKQQVSQYVVRDMDIIRKYLALEFGFDILDGGRKRPYVDARKVFVQILHEKYGLQGNLNRQKLLTLQNVADYMNYPNHSSIIWLLRNWDVLISWDPAYKEIYNRVFKKVGDDYMIHKNNLLEQKRMLEEQLSLINEQINGLENEKESNSEDTEG